MRVVIDTSVLVSAVRSGTGASKALIDLALARRFSLLRNYSIACEYRSVALRPNHVEISIMSLAQIERLIEDLEDIATPVEMIHTYRPLSPDPNDDLVLDLAINGAADIIVTNNLRHLQAPAARFGVQVLNSKNALSKILREVPMQEQVSPADQESTVHLFTSVRTKALEASVKEGISLDEFVNAAVSEKLAHAQHQEWVRSRREPNEERIAETRRLLRSSGSEPPEPGDELPEGFVWPEI